ncbi:MAG: flavodoxin [Bacteroides sp.]|nr:flavodoxin [Prevotella sp.]MCM1408706.1 flavodoxin [Treponema brennaborense]MCM1470621.1 flavodoxin [Bacteroides sp.]
MKLIQTKKLYSVFAALCVFASACAQAGTNQAKAGGKKILVAYYSDTGTTKAAAQKIAKITGADLLEIEIEKPYSSADLDWTNKKSRVCAEHDLIFAGKANGQATASDMKKLLPALKNKMPNFADYGTIFIGYPIWWGVSAWPVASFAAQADFGSADVIPFCTSMSSPLGRSGVLLKEIAGGKGKWKEGKRFGTRATESEVGAWLSEIGAR